MLKKKSERSFSEQLEEAKASGDIKKMNDVARRASIAYRNEMERLRKLEKDMYNKK
jgi:hypothetical protein